MANVLERPHIQRGRSMAQAIEDGTYYELRSMDGAVVYLDFPQATSPQEVLELALTWEGRGPFRAVTAGSRWSVKRILGGPIGCRRVEPLGVITLHAVEPRLVWTWDQNAEVEA